MLSASKKNKIVNSYSIVLTEILNKLFSFKEAVLTIDGIVSKIKELSYFYVNPINIRRYNEAVKKICNELDKNNVLEIFLQEILQRRYLFLLKEICERAKDNLQKNNNCAKLDVYSKKELPKMLEENIKNIIKEQVGEREINFNIDMNMKNESIDFVSKNNICSINLQSIANKVFKKNIK